MEPKKFTFQPNDLDLAERHILHWHVFVPDDVEFKDLFRPEAWAHIARSLQPMARIMVTSESNKFIGELVVVSSGPLWAKVEEVYYKELKSSEKPSANSEYETAWISNRYKFGVKRLADNQWVVKDLPTQAEANQALASFAGDMARA